HYRQSGPEHLRSIGEIEFVSTVRQRTLSGPIRVAEGIVGYMDLTAGAGTVEALETAIVAGNRGLRRSRSHASWDATQAVPTSRMEVGPDLYSRSDFREGLSHVISRNLTIDAWQYFFQLPQLIALVREFPDGRFVLDHCAGILCTGAYSARDEIFQSWRADLRKLARFPNVWLKVGGLANSINRFHFHSRGTVA